MGVDDPKTFISSMNGGIMPATKTSGGEKSPLPSSTVVRQPADLSGLTSAISGLTSAIVKEISKQKKEREEQQRALDYTRLTTQNLTDMMQSYDAYKAEYSGDPDKFAEGFLQTYDKYNDSIKAGITDPKLVNEYEQANLHLRAKMQLQAVQDGNQLYWDQYKVKRQENAANYSNLLQKFPTPSTLDFIVQGLEREHAPIVAKLKAAGKEDEALKELNEEKKSYASTMILRQAGDDPNQAIESLRNPEINKYIPDPDDQFKLEQQIEVIKNRKFEPLAKQAKNYADAYIEALAIGQDGSKLRSSLEQLGAYGPEVVSPDLERRIMVAEQMSAPFAELRNQMVTMSEGELEDALNQLNPETNPNRVAGIDLKDQLEFYESAASAISKQYKSMKENPISTMAGITGEQNPEMATMQYVTARIRAGDNWQDINVLDKKTATQYLNALNNAATAGQTDAVIQLMNELKTRYGADTEHPWRQVAPGVDMLDLALTQLSRSKDNTHPISRKLIAAYHLVPKNQPLDNHNNLLIRAAMMTKEQRTQLVRDTNLLEYSGGKIGNAMDALDARLSKDSKLWKLYFNPASPTPQGVQLLQNQKALLLDTVLLNMASGYKDDMVGIGPLQIGNPMGQTGKQKAIDSIIQQYLPFNAMTVSGNPVHWNEGVYRSPKVFGFQATMARKNFDVNIQNSDLLIHKDYEGRVTPDSVTQFVGSRTSDKDWIMQNLRLPGINDNMVGGSALANTIYDKIIGPSEGGYVANDAGMGPTSFGINFTNNQGILKQYGITSPDQMKNLTKAQAREISLNKYYKNSIAAQAKDPKLAALLLDINFNGGLDAVVRKVPELRSALALPPTAENIKTLDAVYDKVKAARFSFWKAAKGGSQWAEFGTSWTNRQKALDAKAGDLRKTTAVNYTSINPGKRALVDQAMKFTNQNLILKNTEDLRGVRVYTTANGRPVPLVRADGSWLEFSYEEIARIKYSVKAGPSQSYGDADRLKDSIKGAVLNNNYSMPGIFGAPGAVAGQYLGRKVTENILKPKDKDKK